MSGFQEITDPNYNSFENPSEPSRGTSAFVKIHLSPPLCIAATPWIILASQEIRGGTSKVIDAAFNSIEGAQTTFTKNQENHEFSKSAH